jgi:hypothetical protein
VGSRVSVGGISRTKGVERVRVVEASCIAQRQSFYQSTGWYGLFPAAHFRPLSAEMPVVITPAAINIPAIHETVLRMYPKPRKVVTDQQMK